MRRAWVLAAAGAFFGACSSGSSGCDGGSKSSSGESSGFSSGGPAIAGGGGEAVSFQRTGLGSRSADGNKISNSTGTVAASSGTASGGVAAAASAAGAQSVLCGGFPGLPDDCMTSPQLIDLQRECCPSGIVFACRAIPGGARLTARGCPASSLPAAGAGGAPAPAPAAQTP